MHAIAVGPDPASIQCPSCGQNVVTKLRNVSTRKTHILAILLCVFLCWPCVCVPYCTNCCRNTDHHCPSCDAYIGTYRR